ncbi:hypothetical protein NM208_g6915 [Fusarium decemcellulare]|uniref:Uncharacterized protein n=1 Tax=Fusarium decemcellulare TaxID=57161 RepID=A0ACC1SBC6_9HYPO|nr:hypothetical protein NM208_g6915 [Fusarium decemcellulare]
MTKFIYVALLATLARAVKLTNSDYDVVPGKEFTIKWTEAQGPVTLRLKSGPQNNLETVEEITSGQSGDSFTWTVPSNFDSSQYALEIEDGSGDINYSVQFPIEGDGSSQVVSTAGASVTVPTVAATLSQLPTTGASASLSTDEIKDETTSHLLPTTQSVSERTTLQTRTDTERESRSEQDETATETSEPSETESGSAEFTVSDSGTRSHDASIALDMIDLVWLPPRGLKRQHRDRKHPDNAQYYRQWGFTIYRTYYGPDSEKHWNMLLGALKQQTRLAFGFYADDEDTDQGDVQRLKELFHLDAREDVSLLDGLDDKGIREFCQTKEVDRERAMAENLYRFVLLADKAVLKDIAEGEFIVKAVALNWEDGRLGWGWMRIPTGYLLELWQTLMRWEDETYSTLRFKEPEQNLEEYIWPGDLAIEPTGACSEIRPVLAHYSSQRLL